MQTKHFSASLRETNSSSEPEIQGALTCVRCLSLSSHYDKTHLLLDVLHITSKHLDDSLLGAKAFGNSPFTGLWHGNK